MGDAPKKDDEVKDGSEGEGENEGDSKLGDNGEEGTTHLFYRDKNTTMIATTVT